MIDPGLVVGVDMFAHAVILLPATVSATLPAKHH